jgi:hypothetical protein
MSGRGILAGWNSVSAGRQAHGAPLLPRRPHRRDEAFEKCVAGRGGALPGRG